MSEKPFTTPLSDEDIVNLKAGDRVTVSGIIYTARDRMHKYLVELEDASQLPFNLTGAVIYHCGPIIKKVDDAYEFIAGGPTTSWRMNMYEGRVIERYGVKAIIGKGGMDETVMEYFRKYKACYLMAIGGVSALYSQNVVAVHRNFKYDEFGMCESMWEIEVKDFPVIVSMDCHGGNLHREVEKHSRTNLDKTLSQ